MAQHPAAVCRIDQHCFGFEFERKDLPGIVIADDGLKVAVGKPASRLKVREPYGSARGAIA
jgi:hypothetical protein